LLVADHCGAGESTHFDVPHRRLTKEALARQETKATSFRATVCAIA